MKDLRTHLEYVEPHEANLLTFSHRFYELLLRASTEFETVCKLIAAKSDFTLGDKPNIKSYEALLTPLHMAQAEVAFVFWNPALHWFRPFADWSTKKPLAWYQAYNAVKHDRLSDFQAANLENTLLAVSALFVCLASGFERPVFKNSEGYVDPEAHVQQAFFRELGILANLYYAL